VYPRSNSTASITGNLVMDAGNHLITVASGSTLPGLYDFLLSAVITETTPSASIQKEGPGRMRLTANNHYTGPTVLNAGMLEVDGSQPQSPVQVNGGKLQGSGIPGHLNLVGNSAVAAPGSGPGILTCSNFNGTPGAGVLE